MSDEPNQSAVEDVADATGWRVAGTIFIAITVLGFFAGMYFFGQELLNLDGDSAAERLIGAGRGTIWAPIVAILAFVLLGLTGFPQFVMIAAAVLLFGPAYGFMISWTGTMISSTLGYVLGQMFGAGILRQFGGNRINLLSQRLGDRGILATAIMRIVPTGVPFVLINLASGVSHIRLSKYLIGTAIGIVPKMAFIAFIGGSLIVLFSSQNLVILAIMLAGVALCGGAIYWLRRSYKNKQTANAAQKSAE